MIKYQELKNVLGYMALADLGEKEILIINELLDRAIPMKVSHSMHGGIVCNKCYNDIPNKYSKFCDKCGQALDRSKDD